MATKSRKPPRPLVYLAAAMVWAVVGGIGVLAWFAYDLPDVDRALAATRRPTITILAADGTRMLSVGEIHGPPVGVKELPPTLPQAVMATEDRRFYSHFGLDVIGLVRAAVSNIKAGRVVQGGSTITQQVAKNVFLTPQRTFRRKIQELLLALWLERKFSKDQIFTIYLNRVYLGSGAYGVEAAAQRYFGKSARRLDIWQSALLAGLLKAPSRYNPVRYPDRSRRRTEQVLANMVAAGYLSEAEAAAAKKRRGKIRPSTPSSRSRYFSDWVLARVASYVSPGDRDLVVSTTLDRRLQADARTAIASALKKGRAVAAGQAALVAMTPDGAVRAMVGGGDYGVSQYNRATQARRQPGSAFKPIVFLAGLESGMTPETVIEDKPLTIDGWSPRNFSRDYAGPVTMRRALAKSINTVAVRIARRVGYGKVVETARRLGLTADLQAAPSLALGASGVSLLELTAAYGVFASGGYGVWPYGIEKISDAGGTVLYRRQGSGPGRVIGAGAAAAMNAMLAQVINSGTGKKARLQRPAAGKTGTSQNFRDAWFIGYSADLVAGVWIGNDDMTPMKRVTGGGLPAVAWRDFMTSALRKMPPRDLPGTGRQAAAETPERPKKGGFWESLRAIFSPSR